MKNNMFLVPAKKKMVKSIYNPIIALDLSNLF